MRIVIGEDEALLRQGLTHVLEHAGFTVVASAADAAEMIRHVAERRPDLVVTDIRMPPSHTDEGLRAALEIRREWPGTAVVVLSQYVQRRYAVELLSANSSGVGYLLKQRIADVATWARSATSPMVRNGSSIILLDLKPGSTVKVEVWTNSWHRPITTPTTPALAVSLGSSPHLAWPSVVRAMRSLPCD